MSTAYAHFWSLALEREVAKNTVVALEYSGSKGVKNYTIENFNRQGAGTLFLGDNPNDATIFGSCTLGIPANAVFGGSPPVGPGNCPTPPNYFGVFFSPTRRLNDQFSNYNQRGQ